MPEPYPWALRNGELLPYAELAVPAEAHALRYGLSVFEGIRAYRPASGGLSRPFELEAHLERLRRSLELCELPPLNIAGLGARLSELVARNEVHDDAYLRVSATATSLGTMVRPVELTVFASLRPMGRKRWLQEGTRVRMVLGPRKPDGSLLPHAAKVIAHYAGSYGAKARAIRSGFDDVLLLDHRGRLAEAPTANLFLVQGTRLLTPSLECGILPGITRRVLLELAESQGLRPEPCELWPRDLEVADEAFLCGTGIELAPVAGVGDVTFAPAGPVCAQLTAAYFARVRG